MKDISPATAMSTSFGRERLILIAAEGFHTRLRPLDHGHDAGQRRATQVKDRQDRL